MKVTSDLETNIVNYVERVIVVFEDNKEVEIAQITDYDFDFEKIELSTLSFTSVFVNTAIMNKFKSKKKSLIKSIHIEFNVVDPISTERDKMMINLLFSKAYMRNICVAGERCACAEMRIEIEGLMV